MVILSPALRAVILAAVALALLGCSASSGGTPAPSVGGAGGTPTSTAQPTASPLSVETAPAATGSPPASVPPAAPTANPAAAALADRAWATATLTDVTTGQQFTIAGFAGRTVFIESMAIWCTNCRAQQTRFTEALKRLDPAKVAYVVMTVDPSETAAALAKYKADRGFTGTYAVAGKEVSAALAADFGANAINPPVVPLVFITPDGRITFKTGGESVEQIIALAGG